MTPMINFQNVIACITIIVNVYAYIILRNNLLLPCKLWKTLVHVWFFLFLDEVTKSSTKRFIRLKILYPSDITLLLTRD